MEACRKFRIYFNAEYNFNDKITSEMCTDRTHIFRSTLFLLRILYKLIIDMTLVLIFAFFFLRLSSVILLALKNKLKYMYKYAPARILSTLHYDLVTQTALNLHTHIMCSFMEN